MLNPKDRDIWARQVFEITYEDQSDTLAQRRIGVHGGKRDLLSAAYLATARGELFRAAGNPGWSPAKAFHAG